MSGKYHFFVFHLFTYVSWTLALQKINQTWREEIYYYVINASFSPNLKELRSLTYIFCFQALPRFPIVSASHTKQIHWPSFSAFYIAQYFLYSFLPKALVTFFKPFIAKYDEKRTVVLLLFLGSAGCTVLKLQAKLDRMKTRMVPSG